MLSATATTSARCRPTFETTTASAIAPAAPRPKAAAAAARGVKHADRRRRRRDRPGGRCRARPVSRGRLAELEVDPAPAPVSRPAVRLLSAVIQPGHRHPAGQHPGLAAVYSAIVHASPGGLRHAERPRRPRAAKWFWRPVQLETGTTPRQQLGRPSSSWPSSTPPPILPHSTARRPPVISMACSIDVGGLRWCRSASQFARWRSKAFAALQPPG